MTEQSNIESIFLRSLEFEDPKQRAAFLDNACAEHPELREEVSRLISSHEVVGNFLEGESPLLEATQLQGVASRNESVLKLLKDVIGENPGISLREENQLEPVQSVTSKEIPVTEGSGRYQLQGEIARGGMGAVLKGRDTDLGRDLAIKVLLESHKDKPEVVQRFVEEAQIGGQLQHPGIAPVYELGQFEDQRPYFTMKLVKGKTLGALLAERNSLEDGRGKFVGIFEQICQTMAYAHSRGVIHRDLKPANIMVGAFSEVQVMDWGLAKVLKAGGVADEQRANMPTNQSIIETLRSEGTDTPLGLGSQTQMGSVMGTPAYMPPEQALGEVDQLDERSDVFGLGAVLCEILTGKPPYVADDNAELFRMATRAKLDDCFVRLDQSGADEALVKIAKQCLSPEPKDRSLHAGVLADHITTHLETVESRLRESEIDRAAQAARVVEEQKRRKISLLLSSAIVLLIAVLGAGGVWFFQQQTDAAKAVAAKEKERADEERKAKDQISEALYGAQINVAKNAIEAGNIRNAGRILESLAPTIDGRDHRGFEWHMLRRRCSNPIEKRDLNWSENHEEFMGQRIRNNMYWHALSGDRKRYANLVTDDDGVVRLVVREVDSGDGVNNIRIGKVDLFSPNHRRGVSLNRDGSMAAVQFKTVGNDNDQNIKQFQVLEVETGEVISAYEFEDLDSFDRAYATFAPDSESLAIVEVHVPPVTDGEPVIENFVVARLLALDTGKLRWSKKIPDAVVAFGRFKFSPQGDALAVSVHKNLFREAEIRVLDAANGNEKIRLNAPNHTLIKETTFSPDGKSLVALVADHDPTQPGHPRAAKNMYWMWDVQSGRMLICGETDNGFGTLIFSHDGSMVLVEDFMGPKRPELIHASSGRVVTQFYKPKAQITRFTSDDRFIESIDDKGILSRFEIPRNPFRNGEVRQRDGRGPVCISADGGRFARIHTADRVSIKTSRRFLEISDANGEVIQSLPINLDFGADRKFGAGNVNQCVAFDEYGRRVTYLCHDKSGGADRIVTRLVDRPERLRQLYSSAEDEWLVTLVGSPKGECVAAIFGCGSSDEELKSTEINPWPWSPWRKQFRVMVWNSESGETMSLPELNRPHAVTFSPDGNLLAVASLTEDLSTTQITLVRLDKQHAVETIEIGKHWISQIAFSHDGEILACISPDDESIYTANRITGTVKTLANGTVDYRSTLAFCADNVRLVVMSPWPEGRHMRIWNVVNDQLVYDENFTGRSNGMCMHLRFVPDHHRLIGWGISGPPHFWDGRPMEAVSK